MEEADALADRVGVIAKQMLDVGTTEHLRQKYGYGFHIHLVLKSAPHTSDDEVQRIKDWIDDHLTGAELERKPYHGQLRSALPHYIQQTATDKWYRFNVPSIGRSDNGDASNESQVSKETSVGSLFVLLEENKEFLGLAFHSVSPSTFDEVFLKVVAKHGVGEEDLQPRKRNWRDILGYLNLFRL